MSPAFRRTILALAVSASVCCTGVTSAQDASGQLGDSVGEIQNSRFQFEGEVNANAVYVRSGPSDNDYATTKLDKGAKVIVVGAGKFDWLKILPPEGSFCYVAKAYVEKRGDGKLGRVTNALNVRVGSQLLPMKTKVAAKLEPGQDVQIVGEQDEYFKIKPPQNVYLYINKQFVEPVRRVDVPGLPTDGETTARGPAPQTDAAAPTAGATPPVAAGGATPDPVERPTADPTRPTGAAIADPIARDPAIASAGPTTQPAQTAAADTTPVTPTTQPAALAVAVELEFDQLETRLKEVSALPVQQQPVPELLAGYEKLAASELLPESMRRVAEYRVATLKVHNENRELILAHERDRQNREAALLALKREGEELADRMKSTGIVFYTAVGTLRPSSLQTGGEGTLYRLTDPVTGRTLVYIRSTDPKMVSMMGLFVGVQGEVFDDPQWKLKLIAPTDIEPIDQKKVNRSIAAKLIPPSLMPGGALVGEAAQEIDR